MLIKKLLVANNYSNTFLTFYHKKQTLNVEQTKHVVICLYDSECGYEQGIVAQTTTLF